MNTNLSSKRCHICGTELLCTIKDHYIARDNDRTGTFSNLTSRDEVKIYDACDCPVCGVQHIFQERKRTVYKIDFPSIDDMNEAPESKETEKIPDAWIIQDMIWRYIQEGDHTYSEAAVNFGIPRYAICGIMDRRADRIDNQ